MGGANPAARAGDRYGVTAIRLLAGSCVPGDQRTEIARHTIPGQWLGQVFERAQPFGHLPVEIEVVRFTHHQHVDVRFDHLRKFSKFGEWMVLATDIDDQHARGGHPLQRGDRRADAAAANLDPLTGRVGEPLAKGGFRFSRDDERHHGRAVMPGGWQILASPGHEWRLGARHRIQAGHAEGQRGKVVRHQHASCVVTSATPRPRCHGTAGRLRELALACVGPMPGRHPHSTSHAGTPAHPG